MKNNVRAIAFYLPQYHEIPENNEWWGKGFTEWTNVKKAKPLFEGHYQPHIPTSDLGYYDLFDIETIRKQASMAREYGIYGFCFYHYWFGGKKLLEKPLQNLLKNPDIDFPFCACWANENWTRRWDGQESQVLMAQKHSDEDDLAFITDLLPVFSDSRYISVDGKPLLVIYRTELFPDIKRSSAIWRRAAKDAGFKDLYLVRVEGFSDPFDPSLINFDAAIEFAPDWKSVADKLDLEIIGNFENVNNASEMTLYDYNNSMINMLRKRDIGYKLFRGVFPSWDNTARRGKKGTVFMNSSPEKFSYFLKRQLNYTNINFKGDEKMLFINAWNEWGEGCHLEPDEKNGKTLLKICKDVLNGNDSVDSRDEYISKLEEFINYNFNDISNIDQLKKELELVTSSKFWKIRNIYLKIKNLWRE